MRKPRHLFTVWDAIAARVRDADHLAILMDFDGTLAPIRRRPEHVALSAAVRRSLRKLVRDDTTLAVVSGRALADVQQRVGIQGIWYVGAHGYFLRDPRGRTFSLLTFKDRTLIKSFLSVLRPRLKNVSGIQIEYKDASIAVHYRRATPRQWRIAKQILLGILRGADGLRLLEGKKVWEILPSREISKWCAVQCICHRERFMKKRPVVFYLGDDATDETVFRRLDRFSVVIGRTRRTAARYFLHSPAEVRQFLKKVVRCRQ